MEKLLESYDDILPTSFVNQIEDFVLHSMKCPFFYNSSLTSPDHTSFFPGFTNPFFDEKIISDLYFPLSTILYKFCFIKNIDLFKIYVGRVFLQIPLNKTPPLEPHVDIFHPHLVCLYYVNDSDGDTIFYDEKGKEFKRVSPKKGRIAFFDGSIKHSAGSPTYNHRAVINFCFDGKAIK